jgi:hypothetical protein
MGGVLLGCGWMMLGGWDGNFLSAGPVRDAAHERSGVRGSFHGGGGEVLSSRRQWGGGGDGDHKHIFTKTFPLRFFLVTKLLLGHAAVFEALLRQRGSRTSAPLRCGHGEAELPRHVRSQAGAWERGVGVRLSPIRHPERSFAVGRGGGGEQRGVGGRASQAGAERSAEPSPRDSAWAKVGAILTVRGRRRFGGRCAPWPRTASARFSVSDASLRSGSPSLPELRSA